MSSWRKLPSILQPLKEKERWVIWKPREDDAGKIRKEPYQAKDPKRFAKSTNDATWSSYSEAVKAAPKDDGGIGFVLGDGIGCIDLDNCVSDDETTPWATKIITHAQRCGCYIEKSPSGRGYHVIGLVKGAKPDRQNIKFGKGKVELYRQTNRYVTITGETHGEMGETLGTLDPVIDRVLKGQTVSLATAQPEKSNNTPSDHYFGAAKDQWRIAHIKKWDADDIFEKLEKTFPNYDKHDKKWKLKSIERAREVIEAGKKNLNGHAVVEDADDDERGIIITLDAFLEDFVPPSYLIDGVAQYRYLYSLTGKTGSGKSAVTLYLAALVGRKPGHGGRPLAGHDVGRGPVIYFAGENPDDIRIRWTAMQQSLGGLSTADFNVHFIAGTRDLLKDMERIREEAMEIKPALIIVDTARAYGTGVVTDENSNVEMGAYARLLRKLTETGACVIANCHPTKNAGDENLQPVGGGAFVAEVDGNLTCINNGEGLVELHWQTKFRGPEFEPINFELKEVAGPLKDDRDRKIKSVVAKPISHDKVSEISQQKHDAVGEVLQIMYGEDGVSTRKIAEMAGWQYASGAPDQRKVIAALKVAEKQGLVEVEGSGSTRRYSLTARGKKKAERSAE